MNKLVYDIGGSNIKFALMTAEGDILERRTLPTPKDSRRSYFDALVNLSDGLLDQADGVAVSTNGRMFPDGETYRAYTMEFLTGVNLRTELEKRLGMPVVVENDGVAATVGEWWKGAARAADTVLGLVLGSSIGGGMVVNGRPMRGARNNSAMVFGMLSASDTAQGKYSASCLDTVFPLLPYKLAAAKGMQPGTISGEEFFRCVESGDPVAKALLVPYCRAVAVVTFNAALLLDPDCVVVTGGLARQPSLITGIRQCLAEIQGKCLDFPGIDLTQIGVKVEKEDFAVDLRAGELCLDANLYGALKASAAGT